MVQIWVKLHIKVFNFYLSFFNIQIWVNWFVDDYHLRHITKLKILKPIFEFFMEFGISILVSF
jgi:hypothetical protein